MEFIDKVQEREDYEKTPEGKKKKRRETIGGIALLLAALIIYFVFLRI